MDPLHAQDANDTIEYAEKGTGMVATYNAVDPEGTAIEWDVSGADADLFGIEGGVLTFMKSPNFEDKKDKVGTGTSTPDAIASDNVYEVMVEATDATIQVGKKHVKVEVTNVDEAGTVKLSALQPASGVDFTATLTDIDSGSKGLTSIATWQWARSREQFWRLGRHRQGHRKRLHAERGRRGLRLLPGGRRPSTRTTRAPGVPRKTRQRT